MSTVGLRLVWTEAVAGANLALQSQVPYKHYAAETSLVLTVIGNPGLGKISLLELLVRRVAAWRTLLTVIKRCTSFSHTPTTPLLASISSLAEVIRSS